MFTDKEIEEMVEKMALELQETEKKRLDFIKIRQDDTIENLCQYLKEHRNLDGDDFYYGKHPIPFSSEEFHFLFDNMMDAAEQFEKIAVEEDNDFPNKVFFVKFKDMKLTFFIMWGQGTCTQVYVNEETWQEDKSFTYEEAKELQARLEAESKVERDVNHD